MTKKQALSILMPEANTFEALKQAFRKASMEYHPDLGGDEEIMKLVNEAYEVLNSSDWSIDEQTAASKETPLTEKLKAILDSIGHFPDIEAEIIGTWLWITGNTYAYKIELKKAGLKYSKNKQSWYFHENTGYRKFSKKTHSMNDIRGMWGTQDIKTESATAIM